MSSTLSPPALTITSVTSGTGIGAITKNFTTNNASTSSSSSIMPGSTTTVASSSSILNQQGQSLPAGTSISTVNVKQERHDEAEIQELAAKMLEAQKIALAKQQAQQQLAARQAPANNLQTGQNSGIGGNNPSGNILNYLTRKSPITNQTNSNGQTIVTATVNGKTTNGTTINGNQEQNDKKTCDEESQKGHFGWATFGKIHIPYIARQSEKYCAVRMVEMKLLNKYLSYLHPDIYSSCTCVRSYYITEAEGRLLNEINHKHCDAQFGRDLFTLKDLVVRLSDANKFYQFLDICYRKLLTGSKSPSDKCGFIRINKESVVPYTVRHNEQVVPLFYFEGETENLRQKADYLSGWDLAYLKFCCKVQGIRNELFSSESVAVISLTDIKSYFPTGTEFEDYWPSKVVDSNLLIASKNASNSVHWTRQPTAPPPKILNTVPTAPKTQQQQQIRKPSYPNGNNSNNVSGVVGGGNVGVQNQNSAVHRMHPGNAASIAAQQSGITAAVQALTNGWSVANSRVPQGMLTQAQSEVFRIAAQAHSQQQQQQSQRGYPTNRTQMQNMLATQQQYNYNNAGMSMASMNCSQPQQPPPLVRSASQNQAQMSAVANAVLQQHQQHQQQQQQHRAAVAVAAAAANSIQNGRNNQSSASAAIHLQRHAAAAAAAVSSMDGTGRLNVIPEIPTASVHVQPYKVQKVFVFENTMVPCINMKAYNDSDQLMTLTDFREFFFPNVPLEHCKRLVEALGVELYKGNRRQIQTLIESGKPHSESIPLIQVRDVIKYMPQLRYMVRSSQLGQEQPPNKRTRIS